MMVGDEINILSNKECGDCMYFRLDVWLFGNGNSCTHTFCEISGYIVSKDTKGCLYFIDRRKYENE